jgi:hypothetical protein
MATHGSAEGADRVGDDGQEKEHEDGREDARADQLAHRVGAQGAHGVELFGDPHGAELRGHAGGVAAGDHQAGEYRSELLDHGKADQLTGDGGSAKLRQGRGRLQGENAPGEETGEEDNGQRADTDAVGLGNEVGQIAWPFEKRPESAAR